MDCGETSLLVEEETKKASDLALAFFSVAQATIC